MSRARSTDPQTSHDAGRQVSPEALMRQLLQEYRPGALTSWEAATLAGIEDDPAHKRVSDLKTCGLIQVVPDTSGKPLTRPGPTGNPREVCSITEYGLDVLHALKPMPSAADYASNVNQKNREIVERLTHWLTISQDGALPGRPITRTRAQKNFEQFEKEMVPLVFPDGNNEE